MKAYPSLIIAAATVLLLQPSPVRAQDSLDAARQLYASASYDEALSMLERLKPQAGADRARVITIEQYRAYCLLASGRQPEAERAIETIFTNEPGFRPESGLSPRVLSVFQDVRRRALPLAVRHRYEMAKASFDKKAYAAAITEFDAVLSLLESPEVAASDPAFGDLRMLVQGFKELAKNANVPAPEAPAPAPSGQPAGSPTAPPAASPAAAAAAAAAPSAPAVFTAADAGVTPPVVIRQKFPAWPLGFETVRNRRAVLDMVINEAGKVESIAVRPSILPMYDRMITEESRNWSYKPAVKDGTPVKYRKMTQIVLGQ